MKNIIAVGAHPDDIELGCGATIAYYVDEGYSVMGVILTNGEKERGNAQQRVKETELALKSLGAKEIVFGNYPDTKIPGDHTVIEFLENQIDRFNPVLAIIPSVNEVHQDHRTAAQVSITAFRSVPKILSYESPTVTQFFRPTFFVDVTKYLAQKQEALEFHKSQKKEIYMERDAMLNLAKFRGRQTKVELAEAFEVTRFLTNPEEEQ
ncbi:PIG-L deacetylase family protein [Candidatus Omnitrophota bacterium]